MQYTISGCIQDAKNGETLIGSTILVKELTQGTVSNPYGFYSITLPAGSYTLKYSFVGFEDLVLNFELKSNQQKNVVLTPDVSQLDEVIVSPDDSITNLENIHSKCVCHGS